MSNHKRTAREIKVPEKALVNKNINVKVGAAEEREAPKTIYIYISFWLEPKDEHKNKDQKELKAELERELKSIYTKNLSTELSNNALFPKEKNNIYISNIPDNLNYNSKRNFISIELYLHTVNIVKTQDKLPLSAKKNTELYDETVRLSNIIGQAEIIKGNSLFKISKKSI